MEARGAVLAPDKNPGQIVWRHLLTSLNVAESTSVIKKKSQHKIKDRKNESQVKN